MRIVTLSAVLVVSIILTLYNASNMLSGLTALEQTALDWDVQDPVSPAESARVTDVISGTDSLDACAQHGPKCPLNPLAWPGEAGDWQYTGKKWTWHPQTPEYEGRVIVWEWSQPYSGNTPDYINDREDRYSDFTHSPDGYPS